MGLESWAEFRAVVTSRLVKSFKLEKIERNS